LKLENRNWKLGNASTSLYFFQISTFQFQVSSRERLQIMYQAGIGSPHLF